MSEIVTQAGADLRIIANADGTYTAYVRDKQCTFADIEAAARWACAVRDGDERWMS